MDNVNSMLDDVKSQESKLKDKSIEIKQWYDINHAALTKAMNLKEKLIEETNKTGYYGGNNNDNGVEKLYREFKDDLQEIDEKDPINELKKENAELLNQNKTLSNEVDSLNQQHEDKDHNQLKQSQKEVEKLKKELMFERKKKEDEIGELKQQLLNMMKQKTQETLSNNNEEQMKQYQQENDKLKQELLLERQSKENEIDGLKEQLLNVMNIERKREETLKEENEKEIDELKKQLSNMKQHKIEHEKDENESLKMKNEMEKLKNELENMKKEELLRKQRIERERREKMEREREQKEKEEQQRVEREREKEKERERAKEREREREREREKEREKERERERERERKRERERREREKKEFEEIPWRRQTQSKIKVCIKGEERSEGREIISVHVGQCGIQIGNAFWNTICKEHNAYAAQSSKINVYFQETYESNFVPRAVLVDLEPGIMDVIKASPLGDLFKADNMCFGASGAGNNWAKGHYTEGAELIDEAVDIIRHETEGCDCPQGFQLTQSIGGGTGSGMGTLLLLKIRDNYPDRITATFSVYPSPKVSDVVVEPYNATLSIHQLLENSDETFVIDNEALFSISHNVLKQREPRYAHLNWVISMVMSGITASLRFSGKLNGDLRKMGVNLVPFPRLHFFLLAQAPLFAPGQGAKVKLTVQELTDQMWSSRNFLANVKSEDGKYLTASCIYRGEMATQEVDDEVAKIQQKMADDFVTWIPNNIKSSVIEVPPEGTRMSGTFIANTTAIKGVFQRISAQFAKMYKRKAFLHWYKGEGMDEMEFQEADKNVRDLITEYQDKQDAVVDLEADSDDDSDEEDDDDEYDDDEEDEDDDEDEEDEGDF